ncbi:hypothetical protein J4H00_06755 [Enterobacter ludwigii]|nr:hypothetical protein [Enterobacter ludwigii]KZP54307.1 hypothetical protein A3N37_19650 [Enterobacter ludwigii]MBO1468104.1 hypothetical protein [Enterobacter ludwigii]MBO1526679.1 hypothetical protein [Enterobacter ludwigii]UAK89573.1 hypothetical protein K8P07_17045 [Enterobacter ludwigii]
MSYKLNKLLSRIFFKLILLCLALTFINMISFKSMKFMAVIQPVFIALAVIWVSVPLAISAAILYPRACKHFKMKSWRLVVEIRRYYKLTPINRFILYVGSLALMFSFLSQFLFGGNSFFLTGFSFLVMSTSFAIDIYNRSIYIFKKIWSGLLGKIIIALLAALSFVITNYLARRWVYITTDLDPKFFSEFNNIVSIFFTPLSYLILVSLFSLVIVIPEFIGITLMSLLSPIKDNFLRNKFKRLANLSVRMRTGKRIEKLTSSELVLLNSRVLFFRVFSSPIFVCLIFYTFSWTSSITGSFWDTTARLGLVNYYYHAEGTSPISKIRHYSYDGEKISTAIFNGSRWEFFASNNK